MQPRVTRNFRSPIIDELPSVGRRFSLPDGRTGWIAGLSDKPGRLVFVQLEGDSRRAHDVWPNELRGAVVQ